MSPGTDDSDEQEAAAERDPDVDARSHGDHAAHLERYDLIRFRDDHTLIYDSRNERAWIQSEVTIDLAAHA